MTVRYKPDYAGTRALMNGEEMQGVVRQVAEEGMARAVEAAPVRKPKYRTPAHPGGEYKAAFHVEVHADGGIHHDRAEGLIVNDSGHSVLVELHDEFHTLRDAAEELGVL